MIRILICDDEPSYQEILKFKIERIMEQSIKAQTEILTCNSIESLDKMLYENHIDIVFLDVMVNNRNSIDWLISVKASENFKAKFIIMTAFPMESYKISDAGCSYYLIKPKLTNEQLEKALLKAINEITKKDINRKLIKFGSKSYTVNLQDITYIETFNNNITLHFTDETTLTVYSTLKEFSQSLTPNFLRCHKSFMINMNHIRGYEPHKFILPNSIYVPIPPKKYSETIDKYKSYVLTL